jgi:hypothetical protein
MKGQCNKISSLSFFRPTALIKGLNPFCKWLRFHLHPEHHFCGIKDTADIFIIPRISFMILRTSLWYRGQLYDTAISLWYRGHRVSCETSFDSKQPKLEPKLVSILSETRCLFRLFQDHKNEFFMTKYFWNRPKTAYFFKDFFDEIKFLTVLDIFLDSLAYQYH